MSECDHPDVVEDIGQIFCRKCGIEVVEEQSGGEK